MAKLVKLTNNYFIDGSSIRGELIVDSIKSKNMFDKSNIEAYFINASGIKEANSNWRITNYYIKVKPNTSYTVSRTTIDNAQFLFAEYDSSKTLIQRNSDWLSNINKKTYKTTANTQYLIFGYNINYAYDNLQLEEGELQTNYSEYQNLNGSYIESGNNSNGHYIKLSDGTLIQHGTVNLTTGSTAYTNGYTHYGIDTTIDLPIDFIDTNYTVLGNSNTPIDYIGGINVNRVTASKINIRFQSSQPNYTRLIYWLAIGRWK